MNRNGGFELNTVRTLGELFLRSESVHERPFALRGWRDGKEELMPDWRLHRQILRLAMYLRERAGIGPGDRVAIVAPFGPRSIVVEWGAVLIGASAALLTPGDAAAMTSLESLGVRAVFDESTSWSTALDFGGTLDTAERAQSIRASARGLDPSAPALLYAEGTNGTRTWTTLSHENVITSVQRLWFSSAWRDEATMAARREGNLAARLKLYACVGDGRTRGTFPALGDDSKEMERRDT
jgi:acyl-CoA synthetase (AMP-forming)/AMP-acid ligase II